MRQDLTGGAKPRHFDALDSLRGLCAILVCLFHYDVPGTVTATAFVRQSWLFVDFFFVLSGFVIAYNYRERLAQGFGLKRFFGLRFFRLYPLHLVMLVAFVATEAFGMLVVPEAMKRPPFSGHTSGEALVLNLLMLQSFGLTGGLTWNWPSWSIATEFWTYLLFALLIMRSGRFVNPVLILVIPLAMVTLWFATPYGINVTWDWGMVRCVMGFSLGVLCHGVWQARARHLPALSQAGWTALELLVVAAVSLLVVWLADSRANLLLPMAFALSVLIFAREGGLVSSLLKTRVFLFLGTISYSIYMVHGFVQARMDDVISFFHFLPEAAGAERSAEGGFKISASSPGEGWLLILVMLALVLLASWLSWKLVEMPGNREGRRRFGASVSPRSLAKRSS